MAVQSYQTETGEMRYRVYVNIRSKSNLTVRIQKRVINLKTESEAKREELKLIRACEREILEKESLGSRWSWILQEWSNYLATEKRETLNEVTRGDYLGALEKHTGHWNQRQAASITKADVREVINQMEASGASTSYQKKMKVIINRVFTFGIEEGLIKGIDRSPAHGITLQREEQKKPEILTITELRKLLTAARELDHPWFYVWAMALLTGMINGELYALEWKDVDLGSREVSVTKSYNCRKRIIKSTKSGDWRTVPISTDLEILLNELRPITGNSKHLLPRVPYWDRGLQAKELRKFCIGIGLPSVKFHTLRACFATQLIRNGVPPIQLQKICGWKDLETMQRYIRLAGIEISGVTESLKVLPMTDVMARAANAVTFFTR